MLLKQVIIRKFFEGNLGQSAVGERIILMKYNAFFCLLNKNGSEQQKLIGESNGLTSIHKRHLATNNYLGNETLLMCFSRLNMPHLVGLQDP